MKWWKLEQGNYYNILHFIKLPTNVRMPCAGTCSRTCPPVWSRLLSQRSSYSAWYRSGSPVRILVYHFLVKNCLQTSIEKIVPPTLCHSPVPFLNPAPTFLYSIFYFNFSISIFYFNFLFQFSISNVYFNFIFYIFVFPHLSTYGSKVVIWEYSRCVVV